jgi:WD40 repeat protein
MFQKNVSTLIQSVAVFTVAAITVSSSAMMLSVSIAEMNYQIDTAAIGGLFDLVVAIFWALINVLAAGSEALLSGAKIGLYASAAISLTYFLLLFFLQDRIAPHLWRLALALILAEAGAIGATLGASGLDVRYLLWFTAGAALFGLLASLLLLKSQQNRFAHAPIAPSTMRLAPLVALIALIVGAGAILLLILSPFIQPNRSAAVMMRDMTVTEVIAPGNAASVVELARVDAKDVTQALFFLDGNDLAVAMSEGVVLYDVATLTPIRTIETGASRRIAISPDGSSLATIAGTNAQLWAVNDGTLLYTLTGHTGAVQDVAFSPDGRIVATASLDRSVRLWRVSSGDLIYTLSHIGHVYSLDFRMDGQVLATGSDMGITLWQPTSGLRLRITDIIFAIANGVAFSRDGIRLAAAMNTGDLKLREGNNYSISRNLQRQKAITTLAFSPDGQLLAFGGIDQSLHLWQLTGDVVLATLNGHQGTISSVAFSSDGRLLVSAALDGTVRLWGTEEIGIQGTSVTVASATPLTADAAAVSTVVNVAIPTSIPTVTPTATTQPAPRVRVTVFVPALQPASPLEDPTEAPTSTSTATNEPTPSPTATRITTRTVMPAPTQTPAPTQMPTRMPVPPGAIVPSLVGNLDALREVSVGSAVDMAYTADSRWLAVAAVGRVLILDGKTLAPLNEIETQATTLSFSPNGEFLATASGTVASLWRAADGELLNQFELHSSAIMDIAFSPDGATLATASLDQMARLWRVSDAVMLHQFSHFGSVHSLAFSPDGALLATGTTVGVVQWRVSDGQRMRVLTLNPNHANRLIFSSDGQNLAAATENGNIWVWRAGGAGEWLVLQGHTNAATDVAFSVDGQLLASASADGTLRLWRMSDGAALRALSGNVGAVTSVLFHPDGATLLMATADGTLQEWGLPAPVATSTVQTSTRSAETTGASQLDIVAIEPVEVRVVALD